MCSLTCAFYLLVFVARSSSHSLHHSHRPFALFEFRQINQITNHCVCICGQAKSLLQTVKVENLEASGRLDSELHFRVQTNPARFWPPPLSSPSRSHTQLVIATTSHLQTTTSLTCNVLCTGSPKNSRHRHQFRSRKRWGQCCGHHRGKGVRLVVTHMEWGAVMVVECVSEEVARMVYGLLWESGQETEATGLRRERHRVYLSHSHSSSCLLLWLPSPSPLPLPAESEAAICARQHCTTFRRVGRQQVQPVLCSPLSIGSLLENFAVSLRFGYVFMIDCQK